MFGSLPPSIPRLFLGEEDDDCVMPMPKFLRSNSSKFCAQHEEVAPASVNDGNESGSESGTIFTCPSANKLWVEICTLPYL
jgi:hypothetical protein